MRGAWTGPRSAQPAQPSSETGTRAGPCTNIFPNIFQNIVDIFAHLKYFSTSIKKSPGAPTREEAMCDVGGEVYTESDGDDEGVAGDHVYGQVPEVHEPSNLGVDM